MVRVDTDILVIGAGIAGIAASLQASDRGQNVILLCEGLLGQDGASTWIAGGAYQAALYPPDGSEQHFKDTVTAGRFLCNQRLTLKLIEMIPETVKKLGEWGMRWKFRDGKFVQKRLPGHTYPRSMCHEKEGVRFGGELRRILTQQVRRRPVRVLQDTLAVELLKEEGSVVGCLALDMKSGDLLIVRSKRTILATGGYSACFSFTTNAPLATGDGHAMAMRTGAALTDLEFVQFIVAALWPPSVRGDTQAYTLSYELFGIFYNAHGERFMERYYPSEKDFTTRAKQARALYKEIKDGRASPHGGIYLSLRHLPRNLIDNYLKPRKNLPFFQRLEHEGLNLYDQAIEVAPAAHYVCGGCLVDEWCKTTVPGLFAVGEAAGGKDGADRLPGNSLPFCMASGVIAGAEAAKEASKEKGLPHIKTSRLKKICSETRRFLLRRTMGFAPFHYVRKLKELMDDFVKFARTEEGLKKALLEVESLQRSFESDCAVRNKSTTYNLEWAEALRAKNMFDVCRGVIASALARKESRGLHERDDFQKECPEFLKNLIVLMRDGHIEVTFQQARLDYLTPDPKKKTVL